jgi:hypothetical protein
MPEGSGRGLFESRDYYCTVRLERLRKTTKHLPDRYLASFILVTGIVIEAGTL